MAYNKAVQHEFHFIWLESLFEYLVSAYLNLTELFKIVVGDITKYFL